MLVSGSVVKIEHLPQIFGVTNLKKEMKPPRKGWLVSLQIPIPSLMIENIPIETNHPNGVLSTQFVRLLVQSLQAPNPQTSELQGGPRVASYKWG